MRRPISVILSAVALLAACADSPTASGPRRSPDALASNAPAADISTFMDDANAELARGSASVRLAMAEYITLEGSAAAGQTVVQKDIGNKQLSVSFVPRDPRRTGWSGLFGATDDISYAIDQTGDALPTGGQLTAAAATAAIVRGMDTWDNVSCSDLPLVRNPDYGLDIGYVAWLSTGGAAGSPFVFADVQHAGFRDLDFGPGILGVTFTFLFTDATGAPTDIDNDGKADAAFREIYYDPSWTWRNGAGIDVESIALHEAGHGLSQGHFGNIVVRHIGTFDANPRAVMNAFYQAPYTSLAGTDQGGHCSIWASWPAR